ncbi:TetR/AcrR family transcriptional regulator [Corynebacterium auriscanis]|uniref:TetR/AcrR family transcriptional regulator n=1 Tax=Corynebacterium auriscanis TaxID=99807 RepID=UPI003CE8E993
MSCTFPPLPDVDDVAPRLAAKRTRRVQLLRAAADIMSVRGYHEMRLEDLGEAVGISGPAVYRHFSGKEEILNELLTGISEHLLREAEKLLDGVVGPRDQLETLVDFHIDFALGQPELIRLHQRELFRLADDGREKVRAAQGHYLALWATSLAAFDPSFKGEAGKITAQLVTGMINSSQNTTRWAGEAVLRRQVALATRAAVGIR